MATHIVGDRARSTIGEAAPDGPLGSVVTPAYLDLGPDAYALIVDGNCLSPLGFIDGDNIFCDPSAKPQRGDVVAIMWNDPACTPIVKRLASSLPPAALWSGGDCFDAPAVVVEQLNPPKRFSVSMASVRTLHKVVGRSSAAAES